ncbi:MAG TPA: prolyl oligopeptidase family serine peptidase [Mycobacteriales bacterium]|nr:prolyl oligopeptidase family serine peptidase [Mycobacteriales bacterium]
MTTPTAEQPPIARREPFVRELHGQRAADDYAWMRHGGEELVDYLNAERRYYEAMTADSAPLRTALFEEMRRRVPDAEVSVGWRHAGHIYTTRFVEGMQYQQFCRRAVDADPDEVELVLDLNLLAADSAYLAVGVREVSPDGSLLAYSVDLTGDEVFELRFRDLATGKDRPDVIARSYYGCAWNADSSAVLYLVHDEVYRPHKVMRHHLGTPAADATLVYEETDERFGLQLAAARSGEVIVISSLSKNSTEVRLVATADIDAEPWLVAPRREGVEYSVEHIPGANGGDLYVVTNDGAEEFRLRRAPASRDGGGPDAWVDVIAEDPAVRLVRVDAFAGHLMVTLRRDGYRLLRTLDVATGAIRDHDAGLPAGTIRLGCSDDEREPVLDPYDSTTATIVTESLTEAPRWWSLDLATGDRKLLQTASTPSYDPARYVSSRISVSAVDGTTVPVTVAHRADVKLDGTAPCLLYGYGAYEICIDPYFSPTFASLLDRGVVYAIAHIRGGGEGGRNWWRQGSLRRKRNTFTDYITAADALDDGGLVDGTRIAAQGASAGGLLVGAALALAPQRWRAIVALVPFVDCLTTMLDPTMPLTIGEWEEWGDPRTPDDYAYMASYSPYDNVPDGPRPDILATGSLHDSRVMIHEPAKWVARLRATQTDDSTVLFRAETGSSAHFGPSGRYDKLHYQAEIQAFVVSSLGALHPVGDGARG